MSTRHLSPHFVQVSTPTLHSNLIELGHDLVWLKYSTRIIFQQIRLGMKSQYGNLDKEFERLKKKRKEGNSCIKPKSLACHVEEGQMFGFI